jgi:selenium metabolism protein YedF
MEPERTRTIDCRGLACPQPVIMTREALEGAVSTLVVVVDAEGSCTNVARFAGSQGHAVAVEREGGEFRITITKGAGGTASEPPPVACDAPGVRTTVVVAAGEGMGRGDDELGGVLMRAFLDTLAQFAGDISHLVLVNAGVKLAVRGSPVLGQVAQLEEMGVEVLSCGTCLAHFGIEDKLAVGSVSNMYSIVEVLSRAGRIIKP